MTSAETYQMDRTASTAHARLDGHETLCAQEAKHTQRALEALTETIKGLAANMAATNARIYERIDKLMWSMFGLVISVAGAAIFLLMQWLWETLRYKS